MSFSLNILIPEDNEPQPAKSVAAKATKASHPSSSRLATNPGLNENDAKGKRDFNASQHEVAQRKTQAEDASKRSKEKIKIPTADSLLEKSNPDTNKDTASNLSTVGTSPTEASALEKTNDASLDKSESDVQYSRKNPETRPRPRAPYAIIRQQRNAPTEEKPSNESTHIFSEVSAFSELPLFPELAKHVSNPAEEKGMGLTTPTRVQALAIPPLLAGRDCLVKSETGSGKTLSYLLPVLNSLLVVEGGGRVTREDGTYALILAPTRELCLQIFDVLTLASKPFYWIISTAIVGGEKKKSEKARLRKGVNIVVATPGRLADHLRTTFSIQDSLRANALRWFILDEADRLLDSGFEKQVQEILDAMARLKEDSPNQQRTQMVLLSATITPQVENLAGMCLETPVRIDGSALKHPKQITTAPSNSGDESGTAIEPRIIEIETKDKDDPSNFVTPKQLVQHYVLVESGDRLVGLAAYVRRHVRRTGNTCKMLVFVASRACAEFLHALLSRTVWPPEPGHEDASKKKPKKSTPENVADEAASSGLKQAASGEGLGTKWYILHGSVDQRERKKTIKDFGSVRGGVLICTDVAARGLDLPSVDVVIQHDPPSELSEYVHRVGRTARSGRRGMAVMFLREPEVQYLEALKKKGIELTPVKMSYDSLLLPPLVDEKTGKKLAPVKDDELATDPYACKIMLQKTFEDLVESDKALQELARSGYMSWVGAYSVHASETKHIFVTRELHFGHVARSFALKDPPTKIKQHHEDDANKKKRREGKHGDSKSPSGGSTRIRKDDPVQGQKRKMAKYDFKSEFEA